MTAPAASVVVPTFGRPDGLRRCVAALLGQTLADLEVLVVDDGGTPPAAEALAGANDARLRLLRQDNRGPAAARNRGAAAARGVLLAFTDDDCAPRPDWLERLRAARGGNDALMVGGVTVNALANNPFAQASQTLIDALYQELNKNPSDAAFLTSNNIAMSRGRFAKLGGFDESYPLAAGEDRAFCRAWRAAGGRIALEPVAVVDHYHPLTAKSFWRQHLRYGRGGRRFAATDSGGNDGGLGGWRAYGRLVLGPPRRPARVAALLAVAQAATAVGRLREIVKPAGRRVAGSSVTLQTGVGRS